MVVRVGSWNWILSKLSVVLMVAVAIVIFARVVSYLLVENISINTFDSIAISVLKSFLNESQYQTVVNNAKIAGSTRKRDPTSTLRKPEKALVPESKDEQNEQECAVCKYVFPPLVKIFIGVQVLAAVTLLAIICCTRLCRRRPAAKLKAS